MSKILCRNLLSTLNATPYSISSMPEDMTDFGDDNIPEVVDDVNLKYELEPLAWSPIASSASQAIDKRLPRTFVDGAVNSVEIAGSVQDSMGLARSIRAGQLGVGAINLDSPNKSQIKATYILAVTTTGLADSQVEHLKFDLQSQARSFTLIPWQAASDTYFKSNEERELAIRDFSAVRNRLRGRVTGAMLEHEQALVQSLGTPIYADGRYIDHQPSDDSILVIGAIKSMKRRYLDTAGQRLLYNLKLGERTPAFEIKSLGIPVISFYARISGGFGAATGLVRVELSRKHFEEYQARDFSLLTAITSHITILRTLDSSYTRSAVSLEPIKVIEQRMHRIFHPIDQIAISALNLLR